MKKLILACGLLALSGSVFAGDLTDTCKKYVEEVDALIAKASENEAAKAQMDAMKTQMEEGKKQIAAMPAESQDAACKQGLDYMGQMKASMGIQ